MIEGPSAWIGAMTWLEYTQVYLCFGLKAVSLDKWNTELLNI